MARKSKRENPSYTEKKYSSVSSKFETVLPYRGYVEIYFRDQFILEYGKEGEDVLKYPSLLSLFGLKDGGKFLPDPKDVFESQFVDQKATLSIAVNKEDLSVEFLYCPKGEETPLKKSFQGSTIWEIAKQIIFCLER